ncbi:hypothetical protein DSL64_19610 [Dyadobacter luteus]|uniref:Uncharacterized protein n=1 Tax=Dyadobacter luteus TaxID=2259619 RepID=A0A3D8Y7F7_9BACT|nr:hypothetical protein [Dyadobacter luteus]REA58878.1 hypothetical protein DSL64_19610 [Dyadobacter luteus]
MNRQTMLLIIGLLIFFIGCFFRMYGNVEDGMSIMTVGLYLTIVWLIDALLRIKKEVYKLRNEIKELKSKGL